MTGILLRCMSPLVALLRHAVIRQGWQLSVDRPRRRGAGANVFDGLLSFAGLT